MNSKMKEARLEMLKKLSKGKSSEMHEPTIGEALKKKKLSKLPSKEEEAPKKLSKAQELLKLKLGEKFGLDAEEEEEGEEEDEEYSCPACEDEGCEACEEESDEE